MDFDGRSVWCALGIVGVLLGTTPPAHGYYEAAEVTAIRFSSDRAATSGEPLTLLAHQSAYNMFSNGPRRIEEHKLWYVADPTDPRCLDLRKPRILINRMTEAAELTRCRIFRGADTLNIIGEDWRLASPTDWPPQGTDPWRELTAELPPLEQGDVVELAYMIENRWSPGLFPSDWVAVPIRAPGIPTFERHITMEYNVAMKRMARLKVFGDEAPLRRHHGRNRPMVELLTGDLPAGPADPTALDAPRLFFTSHDTWRTLGLCLQKQYGGFLFEAEALLRSQGDSLSATHRPSGERLEAAMRYVDGHCARIPEPLTASSYYPRRPSIVQAMGTAGPLERALMIAGLGGAARMKIDVYLARPADENFDASIPIPMQFDRVILSVALVDEDRVAYIDPWSYPLSAALEAGGEDLLLYDFFGEEQYFYRVGEQHRLEPVEF